MTPGAVLETEPVEYHKARENDRQCAVATSSLDA